MIVLESRRPEEIHAALRELERHRGSLEVRPLAQDVEGEAALPVGSEPRRTKRGADGRLGDVEPLGRPGDRAGVGHREEDAQQVQVEISGVSTVHGLHTSYSLDGWVGRVRLPRMKTFQLPGTSIQLNRMGYGAMQLAGPGVWGPPRDPEAAVAVLREAVALGVNHVDTSDFYGPHVTNQLIRRALHPYPKGLVIVTKVGFRRGADKSWLPASSPAELTAAVDDNLRNLGLDALDVVNLRTGGAEGPSDRPIEEPLAVLAELKRKGKIRHIGLSNVSPAQVAKARSITDIVCVQNHYNLAHRGDDVLIDDLARQGIAYTPYFPLGGFTPLQSSALDAAAASLGATPMQVALAWLLQRSPNILLIPGTSSVGHLRENVAATSLKLPSRVLESIEAP
jgi:aryl-alcohol dehydrogenase-like predicted oxidoreductase